MADGKQPGWVTRRELAALLMTFWAGACLLLMYSPYLQIGRKLIEGVQLPLAYLSAVALVYFPRAEARFADVI